MESPQQDPDPGATVDSEAHVDPSSVILERLAGRGPGVERYRVEGELARGGMGAILRVYDANLRRHLAMKLILSQRQGERPDAEAADPVALGRFLEEAQVTSQLDHPGIVPVHDLGLDAEGRVYFTMKLVKGRDLRAILTQERAAWTEMRAIGVLIKVCEAMAYAHEKGVVHRDLKPANIMVGRFGEVYVMDWGLAKVLSEDGSEELRGDEHLEATVAIASARHEHAARDPESPLLTMDGDVLGTPAYMSPEQAAGKLADLGPRSDVYSVGSMLYHLLAGHMPYGDLDPPPTHMELWKLVRSRPPTPLHVRAPAASPEIVAICEKALERDVGRRYASMAELAEDLHAYVEGRVVRAYETGAVAELRKWVARNRGLAAALLAAVAALAVGLVVTLHLRGESEEQRRNVLNLSAFRKLADLRARADALWPVHPDLIDDYEQWLREARALVGGLDALDASPGHRAALRALRANGRPRDPDELELLVRSHERYGELTGVRSELAARERASDVRARAAVVAEVEIVDEVRGLPAMTLNSLAWALVKPDRAVFGREPEGLAWARLAEARAGPGDDGAEIADTLAWAHLANGLDAEALEWARAAVDAAEPGGRQPYEEKLRAITAAREAAGERARIELLRRRAARLRDEVYGDLGWEFDDEQSAWWHEQLARLVRELDALADEESGLISGASVERGWGIERRLAAARRIEELTVTGAAARAAWAAATEAIARHAEFGGRTISPQPGLLPLGPDPASGLFEFAHVLTGAVPWRAPDGALRVERDTCMVFVLLPGGRFEMGASAAPDAAHHDPLAKPDEAPVHALTLGSFFLSKYELTQAQWTRFVGANPSFFQSGMSKAGKPVFDTNPLESVSWWVARATLARLDLELPTEAQWEYAARAGTPGPWYTGAAPEELDGRANLADRAAADAGERWSAIDPSLSDGYVGHAPVGTFPPNPFGLHEILGNVEEWCRDSYAVFSYDLPPRTGDGEHRAEGRPQRVTRGGSMTAGPREARCTAREHRQADYAFWNLGLRPARALRP